MQNEGSFVPWEKHQSQARILWDDDEEGIPPHETTYTQAELLEYLAILEQGLDGWMEALDLESPESGFSWYKIPKLDHQVVNLRHLGIHIDQRQELMYARGIDLNWVSIR